MLSGLENRPPCEGRVGSSPTLTVSWERGDDGVSHLSVKQARLGAWGFDSLRSHCGGRGLCSKAPVCGTGETGASPVAHLRPAADDSSTGYPRSGWIVKTRREPWPVGVAVCMSGCRPEGDGFDSRTGRVWNHGRRVRRRIGDPVGCHSPCRFESCWFRGGMWSSGHDVGVPCRRRGFESRHPDRYRCPIAQRQSDTLLRWGCRFESCWGSGPAGLPAGPFGTMAEG